MFKTWLPALCCAALGLAAGTSTGDDFDARAEAIVANFTTEQVLGQLAQIAIPALLNDDATLNETLARDFAKLKIGSYLTMAFQNSPNEITGAYGWTVPEWREIVTRVQEIAMEENDGIPMVYGLDSVHGANYVLNATMFGAQINGGASFNPDLVYEQGRISGQDTRAAGIPWVFGPILEVSQNPLWPRTFETFGEDPHLVTVMADAITRGLQSNNQTAACMKHFVAYSKNPTGHDQDGVTISDYDLLNYFLPPFKAAMAAGALSTMENYISINGVPTIANHKILQVLLREDMGFDGLAVSDFGEIGSMNSFHRVARDANEAVRFSYTRTGIDMAMGYDTTYLNGTTLLVEENPEYLDRMKESAKRIIKMKLKLGLFDNPVPGADDVAKVRNENDVATALELARESIVLLQNNDSTLPISSSSSVFLTGFNAHDIGNQCGGFSISWPGYSGNEYFPNGISVKEGMETIGGDKVTYFNGLDVTGNFSEANMTTAKQLAGQADYTIAVIGEASYSEKAGDIDDLALPAGQIEYVKELASTGTKVIVVLFEGRPRLLGEIPENVHAVVHGLLACEQGGKAVAEIIYGQVNPSGRMPITYPKDAGNILIPYNHRVSTQCADSEDCKMQWDFGTGLSYTEFTYSDLALSKTNVTSSSDTVDVSVVVTNSGSMAGKETVMLFLIQPYRSISVPEVKQLKKFSKISLEAGASQTVNFTLTADDWSVYQPQIGEGFKLVAEDTDYVVAIKPETDCDVYNETAVANPLCATFTLQTGVHAADR
ncbi:Lysosomal beta glucosidase [Phytophthora rubi]|uniref:beta-glucosidase n=1 Tax=Phytophthora rubi TaxID=129364 RepID=A0A6A3NQN8_9STRA|nr:Lysosomal beta glucosidase [Phytophthora rubi]KAE9052916.1 Lysosomal beta glucosidase [Phytophthora rubi]KAE9360641.1 Lysosomal beta glucosidase [Phytophthora rubi]